MVVLFRSEELKESVSKQGSTLLGPRQGRGCSTNCGSHVKKAGSPACRTLPGMMVADLVANAKMTSKI